MHTLNTYLSRFLDIDQSQKPYRAFDTIQPTLIEDDVRVMDPAISSIIKRSFDIFMLQLKI